MLALALALVLFCEQLQFQCDEEYVSSVYGCIINGTFCSDHGTCAATGQCQCDKGWEGTYCQSLTSTSDSSLGTARRTHLSQMTHVLKFYAWRG